MKAPPQIKHVRICYPSIVKGPQINTQPRIIHGQTKGLYGGR